jgi:hypothetical protein
MESSWNTDAMLELGHRHADLEAQRELDPLMATMVENPAYEFHPMGLAMSGGDRVRRYYRQFMDDFMTRIVSYELLAEWVNETSVVQEYDITVSHDGANETHRVVGILFAEETDGGRMLLGGERIYANERCVRLMAGSIFDEFEPL